MAICGSNGIVPDKLLNGWEGSFVNSTVNISS